MLCWPPYLIAAGECVTRGQQRSAVMTTEETTEQPPVDDCLKERKWWCFLLSSIFTFLAGLLIVLLWRAFAFLCCRKEPEFAPNDPKQKEQKTNRQGKEFEGTFMTEAKDWAGELISGQTTTGRILVSLTSSRSLMSLPFEAHSNTWAHTECFLNCSLDSRWSSRIVDRTSCLSQRFYGLV